MVDKRPQETQTTNAPPTEPTSFRTLEGVMKIPEPTMIPTMTETPLIKPSLGCNLTADSIVVEVHGLGEPDRVTGVEVEVVVVVVIVKSDQRRQGDYGDNNNN